MQTKDNVKVILAEDHLLFADGVEQILADLPGFEVIAKVGNGKLLMQVLNSLRPDLILLDINMPYMDGIEAAKAVRARLPLVKIVFLSMYYDSRIMQGVKQEAIDGFLMKTIMAPDLKDALVKIVAGEKIYMVPEQHQKEASNNDDFALKHKLSPREMEIIHCIREGQSTKEISESLFLSFHTVETHRKNIFKKLQVKNVAELIKVFTHQDKP